MDPLEEIERLGLLTLEDREALMGFAGGQDPEVRLRAIEKLSCFPPSETVLKFLRERLSDQDELVRLACLEALEDYEDRGSVPFIRERIFDSDWMVRGQTTISLAKFGIPGVDEIVCKRLTECVDEEERVRYLVARFLVSPDALADLKNAFEGAGYRAKCAIAHLTADAVCTTWRTNNEVVGNVRSFLAGRLEVERQNSVRSALINALSDIDETR